MLPTLLTLGNAACGFGSIAIVAKIGVEADSGNRLFLAALLILAGMLFDMLDGQVARWTKQTSQLGAQLDSLCDVISFAVAPPLLMLAFTKFHDFYYSRVFWVIGVLYVLCAVLRLARFNLETGDDDSHRSFTGLPSPAAAGTIASMVMAMPGLTQLTDETMPPFAQQLGHLLTGVAVTGLPLVTLATACLMVSRIRYPHTFNLMLRGRRTFRHLLQVVIAIVVIIAIPELAIPVVFVCYVAIPPARSFWTKFLAHRAARLLR